MKFIGDFHIHSHYSRATSKKLTPEYIDYWARIKGIKVIGTGDFTHPEWTKELKEKLEPAESGLFKLKEKYQLKNLPLSSYFFREKNDVRFILTTETSHIYKKKGKVRKVHNCIFAPNFETVEKIQQKLQNLNCNITSDGRPILGLSCRDMLELCLEISREIFFVPAHIWTPWFSVLGSKSGYDFIEDCFDDLSDFIYALETGLSSDPPLNWMCSRLDKYTLISNSDAHSLDKLGREANIFNTELNYKSIIEAMKTGNTGSTFSDKTEFLGTVEFFPQEGKYYFDGHRKCDICWNPVETFQHNNICSKCGKPVVIGVMNRIVELSDRDDISNFLKKRPPFYSLIPLKEIFAEILQVGVGSKKVETAYNNLLVNGFSEFDLLLNLPISQIKRLTNEVLATAIDRVRKKEVTISPGYDGVFGKIKIFSDKEKQNFKAQELVK